jgi:hypothetical protein
MWYRPPFFKTLCTWAHDILLRFFIQVLIYGKRRAGEWKSTEVKVYPSPICIPSGRRVSRSLCVEVDAPYTCFFIPISSLVYPL